MLLPLFLFYVGAHAAPSAFPKSGNGLWFTQQGDNWSREWLPVGNGYLAGEYHPILSLKMVLNIELVAMIPGGTSQETTQLNIESLWQGGPFADPVSCLLHHLQELPDLLMVNCAVIQRGK